MLQLLTRDFPVEFIGICVEVAPVDEAHTYEQLNDNAVVAVFDFCQGKHTLIRDSQRMTSVDNWHPLHGSPEERANCEWRAHEHPYVERRTYAYYKAIRNGVLEGLDPSITFDGMTLRIPFYVDHR